MSYDDWKTTDPQAEYLGNNPQRDQATRSMNINEKMLLRALKDLVFYVEQLERIVYPAEEQLIDHYLVAQAREAIAMVEGGNKSA